jgi:hypothetical protein
MTEDNPWRIVQIIPAQVGWKAVHCQSSTEKHLEISTLTVVCWAIVERGIGDNSGQTEVRGIEQRADALAIVADEIRSDGVGNDGVDRNVYFLGYDDPEAHKESAYWIRQGNHRLTAEKEKRAVRMAGSR